MHLYLYIATHKPALTATALSLQRRFSEWLTEEGYCRSAILTYPTEVGHFLIYLEPRRIDIEKALPVDVEAYVRLRLRRYTRERESGPTNVVDWLRSRRSPIHTLLRMVRGQWPPPNPSAGMVSAFETELAKRLATTTVEKYTWIARRFLDHLATKGVALSVVTPVDVTAFVSEEAAGYRRRNGRRQLDPDRESGIPTAVGHFLRHVHGQWPPRSRADDWLDRMKEKLDAGRAGSRTKSRFLWTCRDFLLYVQHRNVALQAISPIDVDEYRQQRAVGFQRQHERRPTSRWIWRLSGPIHAMLRLALGQWPPPLATEDLVRRFRSLLIADHFDGENIPNQVAIVRGFLKYLGEQGASAEEARPQHFASYLESRLAHYRHRHDRPPTNLALWRYSYTGPIKRLLTLAQGQWPPPSVKPMGFRQDILGRYERRMIDLQGLSQASIESYLDLAKRFLAWFGDNIDAARLSLLTIGDIDAFLAYRNVGLKRSSRHTMATSCRCMLRFLHAEGWITHDLAKRVFGPGRYQHEGIPSALSQEDVHAVLERTRRDETMSGRRDYAILTLLASYGLRASEVARLRVDDIDWRQGQIRIAHSKTGAETFLPIVECVGESLIAYLRGRQPKIGKMVFLPLRAPARPSITRMTVGSVVRRRLLLAGIRPAGKHGPHAFRHARAVSLLRSGVPMDSIGKILGHRSASSTRTYLKLATDDLRAVALDLPKRAQA